MLRKLIHQELSTASSKKIKMMFIQAMDRKRLHASHQSGNTNMLHSHSRWSFNSSQQRKSIKTNMLVKKNKLFHQES